MKEQLILKFILPRIEKLSLVEQIVSIGYRKTGNKFTVAFNGSKGYLSNIEISCEGKQKASNRIFVENLRCENGSLQVIMVNLFYSAENGIRLSIGDDDPQVIEKEKKELIENFVLDDDSDLPF